MNERGLGTEAEEREMGKQSVASISRHRPYSLKWLPLATMEMHSAQWNTSREVCLVIGSSRTETN